jgi:hypothetical protein
MDQHQARQEPELPNGIVRTHDSLPALLARNTDTNVRLLNHGHVVGAITDTKGHDVQAVLDHGHDGGLLRGADTAAEHGPALLAEEQELLPQLLVEHELERVAVDDNGVGRRGRFVVLLRGLQLLV